MRYIRSFVVVFVLLFFLAHTDPVYAVDSLFSVEGCSNDPTATPCATTGNGYNTIIPLSKTVSFIAAIANNLLGPQNIVMSFIGELTPQDSYHIGSEKLTTLANQIQTAGDTALIPADLQLIEQHNEASKPGSMTSILCVYDPITGLLLGNGVKSSTIINTDDQSSTGTLTESARRLASYTTGYVQESQDYRTQDIVIKQDAALPCKSQLKLPGKDTTQNPAVYQNANIYGSGTGATFVQILFNITKEIFDILLHNGGSLAFPTKIFGTGLTQFTGHTDALIAGCASPSDLDAVDYATAEQKQKLCETGGFVNSMYRPDFIDATYKSELNAKDTDQQWNETITNEILKAPNSNAFNARIEASGDYMNCTLMPADYQGTALPNGECKENWSKESSVTPSGSCAEEFKGMTPNPSQYDGFNPSGGPLLYSLDIHNSNCTVNNIENVANFAKGWGAGNPTEAYNNVVQYYPLIEQYAKQYGWNPAYLLTQWIEESVAGTMGDPMAQLGCKGPNRTQTELPGALCEQIACVFKIPSQIDFWAWLCNYAGKIDASVVNNHCTSFNFDGNECYPERLLFMYNEVINRGGVTASGCATTGTIAPTLRTECPLAF